MMLFVCGILDMNPEVVTKLAMTYIPGRTLQPKNVIKQVTADKMRNREDMLHIPQLE